MPYCAEIRRMMSQHFSVAIGSWPTSVGAKWPLMICSTGPPWVVIPIPNVPSSAVTTQAVRCHGLPQVRPLDVRVARHHRADALGGHLRDARRGLERRGDVDRGGADLLDLHGFASPLTYQWRWYTVGQRRPSAISFDLRPGLPLATFGCAASAHELARLRARRPELLRERPGPAGVDAGKPRLEFSEGGAGAR